MTPKGVLLDTSFFLRFLNENEKLFKNADDYFKYLLSKNIPMFVSTLSIAEFCVGGEINQLPLKNLRILPFNINHAIKSGEFARFGYLAKAKGFANFSDRKIIPNDCNLFAQASIDKNISHFLTSDENCIKLFEAINKNIDPAFNIIEIIQPYAEAFGVLAL